MTAITTNLKTPLEMLYQWEKTKPDATYLSQPLGDKYHHWTWKEAGQEVRRMAAALKALDFPPQSNIALISKNCAHWMMTDLAIMMAGHVSVPMYPNLHAETVRYILEHSQAKAIFIGKLDDWDSMKSGLTDDILPISFPLYGPEGYNKWEDLTAKQEPIEGEPNRTMDETMTIIYTSGTTGTPKGVVHNFEALAFATTNALKERFNPGPNGGRFFSYLPLSHIAERLLTGMGGMYSGGQVYFAQSLDTFNKDLSTARPTVFLAVPRIWTKFKGAILSKMPQKKLNILLKIPVISGVIKKKIQTNLGLDQVQHVISGAAPIAPSLLEWYQKLGLDIQEAYGMTENAAYSQSNPKGKCKIGTVGTVMPGVDCKISDIGEILVKSKATMQGYYKEPEKTADTMTEDGYLKTGDQGEIDANGYLKITGRVKDIFKTAKAKYVAPSPIELKLSRNHYIEQVCVVGTGMPQPMAMIVLTEEGMKTDRSEVAESLQETFAEVNPTLAKHEKLKKAIIMQEAWTVENEMLTPSLKIKRNPLEKKFSPNYDKWYEDKDAVVWS
ncbi:MAG: AMP-binding protein [Chitinophagales bacterium]